MSDFDAMLWRPINPGNEFDKLIPKSTCKSTFLGEGLTDFSIDKMEQMVLETLHQTKKLAVALQKETLEKTCNSIHHFLYNHFQYKADDSDQMLRSPACSWYDRQNGIDCKSYSIAASSLLLNMNNGAGITHYIRKIKQPGYASDEFTHVYVIVPIDQTNGSLLKGYYTIDGTLSNTIEPAYVAKSDLKMSANKHYGLNAASLKGVSIDELKALSKQVSLKNVKTIVQDLLCVNSAVSQSQIVAELTKIDTYYQDWQVRFNTSIQNRQFATTGLLVAEVKANTYLFINCVQNKIDEKWNDCTTRRLKQAKSAYEFQDKTLLGILNAYLSTYFNLGPKPNVRDYITNPVPGTFYSAKNTDMKSKYGLGFGDGKAVNTVYLVQSVTPKGGNIPAFAVPKYVTDQANSGSPLNLETVLGLLETGAKFLLSNNTQSPTSGGSYTQETEDFNPDGNTSKFGMGSVVGAAIVSAAAYYALKQGKSKTNTK